MADHHGVPRELHVLVPFWGMAGGVIKILDYAHHGILAGVQHVRLWSPDRPPVDEPVTTLPVFRALMSSSQVTIETLDRLSIDAATSPVVLFTEPTHHKLIERATSEPLGARLIHLVQGTRHADPAWSDGRNYRLLHRPMSRIMVTDQVAHATRDLVNTRFPTRTILEGHDVDFFAEGAPRRSGARSTHRVLYATWKSDLGDRVAAHLRDRSDLSFDAIRRETGWPELRRRYHGADIFLCSPGPQEGFYLPGLEAMAAGCAVISSLVGGNESYMIPGDNMLEAAYDDAAAHAEALVALTADSALRDVVSQAGVQTAGRHRLEREAAEFAGFLASLDETSETLTSLRGADR